MYNKKFSLSGIFNIKILMRVGLSVASVNYVPDASVKNHLQDVLMCVLLAGSLGNTCKSQLTCKRGF